MKVSTTFMILMAIEFSIILFSQGTYQSDTPISSLILNPSNWGNATVLLIIGGIAAAAIVGGSFVGGLIIGKTDVALFGAMAGFMISWLVPIVSLWSMIYSQGAFGSTVATVAGGITVTGNAIMASIITAPLILLAIFSILNWWRTTGEG